MTTVEILKAAKELISDPKRWAIGQQALDAQGYWVESNSPRAVCWCGIGAVAYVAGQGGGNLSSPMKLLHRVVGGSGFVPFNDTHPHIEVLAKFDEAIALAEEEERCAVS